jgi:iron(II)-dependent oxidoreductase
MSTDLSNPSDSPAAGWRSCWFSRRRSRQTKSPPAESLRRPSRDAIGPVPDGPTLREATTRLVAQHRYAFVLLKSAEEHVGPADAQPAWLAIEREMALIPGGLVPVVRSDGSLETIEVPAFYLDRCAVTNRQFQEFVAAGCYDALEIWPREVWPSLMRFTDRTGQPGPAGWEHAKFPAGKAGHPVAGVCWYEASAYAQWVGKRLATAAEWQKAGGWPEQLSGGHCNRYPWGNLFDPARANLCTAGLADTAPVDAFAAGDTPNGIHQMTGNIWEWLDDPLDAIPCQPGEVFQPWKPMRRIQGGAFDTYLPAEATCHFVTGHEELGRRANIGFRCALSAERLRDGR